MNVFDLQAKLGLNTEGFDKALSGAGNAIKGMASTIGSMVKVGVAGFSAVSAGVAAISKSAIDGYADYEQLVGGVDTLFKDSSKKVQEYAANAYKTAGMSANEYMETVTSFSASLLQSLDGDTNAAAEKANMAITDMSDNANKMGSSMESIQNAYSGFAKQNYTMLDNLKLGYGGTAAEMERLIQDAEKIDSSFQASRDENGKLTMSYGEVVDAIHIVQTNMDITGTTAKEAATTISGSMSMMKASWENLLVGVADDSQDFDRLINEFVDSVDTVAGNIIPRVQIALEGVGKLVEKLVPTILERLPDLIMNTLPKLMESTGKLIQAIGGSLVDNLPYLLGSVRDLLFSVFMSLKGDGSLGDGLGSVIQSLIKYIPQISQYIMMLGAEIIGVLGQSLIDNVDNILACVRTLLYDVMDKVSSGNIIGEGMITVIDSLINFLPHLASELLWIGRYIIENIAESFKDSNVVSELTRAFLLIVSDALDFVGSMLPLFMDAAFSIIMQIGEALIEYAPYVIDSAIWIIESFAEYMAENAPVMIPKIVELITQLALMLTDPENISRIIDASIMILNAIVDGMINALPILLDAAPVIIENLVTAITENLPKLLHCAGDIIKKLVNGLLINLPQIIESGGKIIDQLGYGITSSLMSLNDACLSIKETMHERFKEMIGFAKDWGKDLIDNFIGGIKDKFNKLKETVSDVAQSVKDFLGFSEPKSGPLSNFHTYAPDMMDLFASGIKENTSTVTDQLDDSLEKVTKAFDISPEISPIEVNTDKLDKSLENASESSTGDVNNYYITVTSGTISSDYDARRAAQIMSEELGSIRNFERMAVGG